MKNPGLDIQRHFFFQSVHLYCRIWTYKGLADEWGTNKLRGKMFSITAISDENLLKLWIPATFLCPTLQMVCAWCSTASLSNLPIQYSAQSVAWKKQPKVLCFIKMFSLFLRLWQWGLDFLLSSWEVSTCLNTFWIGLLSWGEDMWCGLFQAQSDKWVLSV